MQAIAEKAVLDTPQTALIEAFLSCEAQYAQGNTDYFVFLKRYTYGTIDIVVVLQESWQEKLDHYLLAYTKELYLAADSNIRILDVSHGSHEHLKLFI